MRKLIGLLIAILLTLPLFSQTLKEESVEVIVKKVRCIDNITINPNTKTIIIRTYISWRTSNGKEIKRDRGKTIVLRDIEDNPSTEINERKTEYSDFIKATGLKFDTVVNAIKEIIKGKKE